MTFTASRMPRLVCLLLVLAPVVSAQDLEGKLNDDESRRLLFAPVADKIRESTVEILDEDDRAVAMGLVVAQDLVATKASEVPEEPACALHDGRMIDAVVVAVDEDYDIALLAVDGPGIIPAKLDKREVELGRWMITPAAAGDVWSGIVSVKALSIHRTNAFLGVMLENLEDAAGARVSQVVADSAAEAAGLQTDDVIVTFGGKEVTDREGLIALIRKQSPGDTVPVVVKRGDEDLTVDVTLGRRKGRGADDRPERRRRRWRPRGTILSSKSSGFRRAFQHDTLLDATDCGGPVVDLEGRVVGLNIARASRTETLAVPSADLHELVRTFQAERARRTSLVDPDAPKSRKRRRL